MKTPFLRVALFATFAFLFLHQSLFSASFYWVGGTGEWADTTHWARNSGGVNLWDRVPGSGDSLVFDNSSFDNLPANDTVYVSGATVSFRDMDWRGFTNTASTGTPVLFSRSTAERMSIHGSLWLSSTMQFSYDEDLEFFSIGAAEIQTASHAIRGHILMDNATGVWNLLDDLQTVVNSEFELLNGRFNVNGHTMSLVYFKSDNDNPRTFDMSNSTVNITGRSHVNRLITFNCMDSTNLVFHAGNSLLHFTQPSSAESARLGATGLQFNEVVFDQSGIVRGESQYEKIRFLGNGRMENDNEVDSLFLLPNKTLRLNANTHQSITGDLVALGSCAGRITILASGHANRASMAFPNGPVNLDYVNIQSVDITTSNANATNSIDLDGTSTGWTLSSVAGKSLYWIGGQVGGSDWGDASNWSEISGVSSGNTCLPSALDDVIFDDSSFTAPSQQVIMNITGARFRNMTWSGVLHNPEFVSSSAASAGYFCHGNLTYDANMETDLRGQVQMVGSSNHTIEMNGQKFSHNLVFNNPDGTWTLLDGMYIEGPNGTQNLNQPGILYLICGTLNTNGEDLRANAIHSNYSTPRTLNLGSSYVHLVGRDIGNSLEVWTFSDTTNLTFNAGTSTIEISDSLRTPSLGLYTSRGQTFHNVIFSDPVGVGTVHGNNRIHKLTFVGDGILGRRNLGSNNIIDSLFLAPGKTYRCREGSNTTLGYLEANGTCSEWIYINSLLPGSQANWQTIGGTGTINATSLILQDNNAQNGTFNAANSVEIPAVSGWNLSTAPGKDYYWRGGTGDWGDTAHWSIVPTFPPMPDGCIPGPNDNVFFDAASFTAANQVVTIDVATAYCRNMSWTGATGTPEITYNGSNQLLRIFGSLTMIPAMNVDLTALDVYFNGAGGNFTIESGGQTLPDVFVAGAGSVWEQLDDLMTRNFFLVSGTFETNDHELNVNIFSSNSNFSRTLDLGSSLMTVRAGATNNNSSTSWRSQGTNYNLLEGNSTIQFTSLTLPSLLSAPDTFNIVEFVNPNAKARLYSNSFYRRVTMLGNGEIWTNARYDTLEFTPGKTYELDMNHEQWISNTGDLVALGTPSSIINIASIQAGSQSSIRKDSGVICLDYVDLRDNAAIGGADFYAGNHSVNTANNTGWVFDSCGLRDTLYVCEGDSVLFDEDDFSNGSWFWNFGDPLSGPDNTSTQPAPIHVFSGPGTYAPTVDVMNLGSSDRRYKFVVVNPSPNGSIGQTYGTNPITLMDSATLTAGGGVGYVWSTGDTTANMSTTVGGTYSVTITDANGCTTVEQFVLDNPLSVAQLEFSGEMKDNEAHLFWQTLREVNTDYFTLERSGDQGLFESVGQIPAAGESEFEAEYSFVDREVQAGLNHYQLRLYDQNGAMLEARMVSLFNDLSGAGLSLLAVYPQPNQGELNLRIYTPHSGIYTWELLDLTGRKAMGGSGSWDEGIQETRFDLNRVANGAYLLKLTQGGSEIRVPVVRH